MDFRFAGIELHQDCMTLPGFVNNLLTQIISLLTFNSQRLVTGIWNKLLKYFIKYLAVPLIIAYQGVILQRTMRKLPSTNRVGKHLYALTPYCLLEFLFLWARVFFCERKPCDNAALQAWGRIIVSLLLWCKATSLTVDVTVPN